MNKEVQKRMDRKRFCPACVCRITPKSEGKCGSCGSILLGPSQGIAAELAEVVSPNARWLENVTVAMLVACRLCVTEYAAETLLAERSGWKWHHGLITAICRERRRDPEPFLKRLHEWEKTQPKAAL